MEMSEASYYIIRVLGRLGFVFLIVNFYRLFDVMASPLLKARSKKFVWGFTTVLVISLFLMVFEVIFQDTAISLISLIFNVASVFVLAWYLGKQSGQIERRKETAEYKRYAEAMDDFLETLKRKT